MNNQQKRIAIRLLGALMHFKYEVSGIGELLQDLEANIGAIEVKELNKSVESAANRIDEFINTLNDKEAQSAAERTVEALEGNILGFLEQERQ